MGISLSLMGSEVACPVIISSSLGHMSTEKVLLLAANLLKFHQSEIWRNTQHLRAAYIAASSSTVS